MWWPCPAPPPASSPRPVTEGVIMFQEQWTAVDGAPVIQTVGSKGYDGFALAVVLAGP
jgi:hypothetical protein